MDGKVSEIDIQLNALADGELDSRESEMLLGQVEADADLRTALCDIHRVKDMMHYAYADEEPPIRESAGKIGRKINLAIAASVVFAVGALAGFVVPHLQQEPVPFALSQVETQPQKVVLYVGFSDNERFETALVKARELLEQYADRGVRVNVVTSAGGIDLLREGSSPYLQKVKQMAADYNALSFVACNNTLAKLKAQGELVELIDEAEVAPSAVEYVVGRLQEGWSYIPI
ncbi:MAG: hypothetical protein ACWA5Q_09465 [bacterium]